MLNGTKNYLTSLPLLNSNRELNNVKELYLSGNELGNDVLDIVGGYSHLQILHLAYNELTELYERLVYVCSRVHIVQQIVLLYVKENTLLAFCI